MVDQLSQENVPSPWPVVGAQFQVVRTKVHHWVSKKSIIRMNGDTLAEADR